MSEVPIDKTDPAPPNIMTDGPWSGSVIDGRYRLEVQLGVGGGGTVWSAVDEKLNQEVALKIINRGGDPERWRREVALARRISHPNVCRVFDLGETEKLRWVSMALVRGNSLRQTLHRGQLDSNHRYRLMEQMVAGVAAIHTAGVIHRDIKPENIIVDGGGNAIIVDFGIAREPNSESKHTHTGAIVGTPGYMAPEQALGQAVDRRTDVFALGKVLHELATGVVPKPFGDTQLERPSRAKEPVSEPIRPPWDRVISRCLAFDPDDRFRSAVEISASFESTGAHRVRTGWQRLRRILGLLLALAVIATLSVMAFSRTAGEDNTTDSALTEQANRPRELAERRVTFSESDDLPLSVALAADGETLAYTRGTTLVVQSVSSGQESRSKMPTTSTGKVLGERAVVIGFFADKTVAVHITDRRNKHSVWRVGPSEPANLFERETEFQAALSPDGGQIAIATPSLGLELVPVAAGAGRRLVTSEMGEQISAVAWSPDSKRLVFVRYPHDGGIESVEIVGVEGGGLRVVTTSRLGSVPVRAIAWPGPIVFSTLDARGDAILHGLDVTTGKIDEWARWTAQEIAGISGTSKRLALLRGTQRKGVLVGSLSTKHGFISSLKWAHPSQTSVHRLAGWTPGGRLVYSTTNGDSLDVVAATMTGEGEVLVGGGADFLAETIDDTAILYHRRADSGSELFRLEPGAKPVPLGFVSAVDDSVSIRCAGDRKAPCLLEEVDVRNVRYFLADPQTGVRGREVHVAPKIGRVRGFAVSPDGASVALVDGSKSLRFFDIKGGKLSELEVEGASLRAVSWAQKLDSVVVSATGYQGNRYSLLRVDRAGKVRRLEKSNHREFLSAHESHDGEDVAVHAIDRNTEVWLLNWK